MKKLLKGAGIVLGVLVVACIFLYMLGDDEPVSESESAVSNAANESESNFGEADSSAEETERPPPSNRLVTASLETGEALEGKQSSELEFGSGYEEAILEESYDPDKEVKITRSARPIRPVQKQDVYGRILSGDFYFYRNMLGSNERAIYDQIYANALDLDTSFDVSGVLVPYANLDRIVLAVRFDNPDLFWLSNRFRYTYDRNGNVSSVTLEFFEAANNLNAYKEAFYSCTDSVLEQVMYFDEEIDKIKYIHDFLITINDYNWGPMNQSAYSAVCYGETVCAGYAAAFQYYMQRLGIPSAIVYGTTKENHLWNIVYLDGDFYAIDITWDDPIGNPSNVYYYNYFNITDRAISQTHSRVALSTQLPGAQGTWYSYNNIYGSLPGTNFAGLDYGSPHGALPPVYPGAAQSYQPSSTEPDSPPAQPVEEDVADEFAYDVDDATEEDYDTYYEFYDWTDAQWEQFWDLLEAELSEEELAVVVQMEWEEFFAMMQEAYSE